LEFWGPLISFSRRIPNAAIPDEDVGGDDGDVEFDQKYPPPTSPH